MYSPFLCVYIDLRWSFLPRAVFPAPRVDMHDHVISNCRSCEVILVVAVHSVTPAISRPEFISKYRCDQLAVTRYDVPRCISRLARDKPAAFLSKVDGCPYYINFFFELKTNNADAATYSATTLCRQNGIRSWHQRWRRKVQCQ
jgi:hypothetical protein